MTKDDLKNSLTDMHTHLAGLEAEARKLQNQNLADVVKSAMGKVQQLSEHPDLERVTEGDPSYEAPKTAAEAVERMRADGDADPEGTARMNWPLLFEGPASGSDFPAQQGGAGQQAFVPPRT